MNNKKNPEAHIKPHTRHSVQWALDHNIIKENVQNKQNKQYALALKKPCTKQEVLEYLYLFFKNATEDKE